MQSEAAISFRDLTLGYRSHAAVHHLSADLEKGSLTAVVGANGSGKSTLLKGIAGMLKPLSGGCAVRTASRLAYLPQQSELDRSFPARVGDLVAMGLWPRRGLLGRHGPQDRKAVAGALRAVGLDNFETRSIDSLSGGQLQRALFARVLLQDADIILLDEPFNAVDGRTLQDLLAILRGWHAEGRTVVVVVHDLELVRSVFPQALLLARRPVAFGPTSKVLTAENLMRASGFDEAWHEDAPWCADDRPHDHDHAGHDHAAHEDRGHAHGDHEHVHAAGRDLRTAG